MPENFRINQLLLFRISIKSYLFKFCKVYVKQWKNTGIRTNLICLIFKRLFRLARASYVGYVPVLVCRKTKIRFGFMSGWLFVRAAICPIVFMSIDHHFRSLRSLLERFTKNTKQTKDLFPRLPKFPS